jgi:hypothetical protein
LKTLDFLAKKIKGQSKTEKKLLKSFKGQKKNITEHFSLIAENGGSIQTLQLN